MRYTYDTQEKDFEPVVFEVTDNLARDIEEVRLSYNEELIELMIWEEVYPVEVKNLYVVN